MLTLLRHVHGDHNRYTTAHAARDALAAARDRATPPSTPPATPDEVNPAPATGTPASSNDSLHHVRATYSGQRMYLTYSVGLDLTMRVELQEDPVGLSARNVERLLRRIDQDPSLTDVTIDGRPHITTSAPMSTAAAVDRVERDVAAERTPPDGWTEADRVRPAQPRDTASYRSAQQFPLGAVLTVHAIGDDGPGRQLGHGVVDDHPGPNHVTVESPHGTRRTSPITHVQPADPNDPSRPAPNAPSPSTAAAVSAAAPAADRWTRLFAETKPEVLADPHWPTLVAQMDRIAATGADVAALVDQVVADRALPADHPARSLDYRLANVAPDPAAAERVRFDAGQAARTQTPPAATPPADPGYRPGPRL